MPYLSFMSDEHLEKCIDILFNKYEKTKRKFTEKEFYKNQVDPIKLLFDTSFFGTTEEQKILEEIQRKIDKTISNAIGEFHEDLIGGIKGYKKHPVGKGFDITDENCEKLFADIKNKHNTVTGTHLCNLYIKLEGYIEGTKEGKSYWVQIISSGSSFEEPWVYENKDKTKVYKNPNVYKVSADKFYEILTGNPNAFSELCEVLPHAIEKFLEDKTIKPISDKNSEVYNIINQKAKENGVSFINQIMNDTFSNYNGFPIGKK